jgi:hypothetical protein
MFHYIQGRRLRNSDAMQQCAPGQRTGSELARLLNGNFLGNIDLTTSWGKVALAVLGSPAEIYCATSSSETERGKQGRVLKRRTV